MRRLLDKHDLVLMEAAVVERLRRGGRVELHPTLDLAHLLYDETGRHELEKIYQGYIDIAMDACLPFIMCTPTRRTNRERVKESRVSQAVNSDAVQFMTRLRDRQRSPGSDITIAGLMGCRNDCYKPEEGLSASDAEDFHSWQSSRLAEAGVDCLMAVTLPNVEEAVGMAKAMAATGAPYIISFVINREGHVLDGTPLQEAICVLDEAVPIRPVGFMVNCAHPVFLGAGKQPRELFTRLIGYQGNGSSLDQIELEGQSRVQVDDVSGWAREMLTLNRKYGVKILGGCCGTGNEHLTRLVAAWRRTES